MAQVVVQEPISPAADIAGAPRRGAGYGQVAGRRVGASVAGVLVISAVTGGCTADGDQDRPVVGASTPGLRAPSQDPRSAAQAAAIVAYRAMWVAYGEAGETADPGYPALRQYASGAALKALTKGLSGLRARSQVTKGQAVLAPRVQKVTGDPPSEVRITDCADTTKALIYRKTGGLINDVPGGRQAIGATVTHIDTGWKVSSFGVREVGSC